MKLNSFLFGLALIFSSASFATTVNPLFCDIRQQGGDYWPWSIAKPFPWDDIQGFWQLSDTEQTYMKARVLSTNSDKKILSLTFYSDSICNKKSYARGTGYIDFTEKNVVTALISDGTYRYQVKLGMFDTEDLSGNFNTCGHRVLVASMQILEQGAKKVGFSEQLDPAATEVHNVMLKKVTDDPNVVCKKSK